MEFKKTGNTYIIRFNKGEELVSHLTAFAKKEGIKTASVVAIGATDNVTFGAFNPETKKYQSNTYTGALEITNLTGNITSKDKDVYLHLHITVGDEKGASFGGHLNSCNISVTCEMFVTVYDTVVERKFSDDIGINLMEF